MFSLPRPLGLLVLLAIKSVIGTEQDSCGPDIQTIGVLKTYTTIITTGVTPITSLDSLTEESLLTAPHLCYTHTVLAPYTLSTTPCIKIAECLTVKTLTEYRPRHDTCCDSTPTITLPSPSPVCKLGCGTKIIGTTTITLDSSAFFHPISTSTALVLPQPDPSIAPTLIYSEDNYNDGYKLVKKAPSTVIHPASATPPPLSVDLTLTGDVLEEEDTVSYSCTRTMRQMVTLYGGDTSTFAPNTYTTTETMDGCDGCTLVTQHWGGPGPVVFYSATVTDPSTRTATRFVCKPTGD
ncbi:hypothetical protein L207DRAFT_533095 [Hyaloscypha variabilis F]|uniref:Ig-like domain-containing protein n=1 Tax=Hyaloscypha variabilis (strain UAMH 11265 / GT02V1 / F) TaxID=1149755 RepID=A0A2J6RCH1_HYAVF|nr:hypothetical protein L207DRAFT_533095 [Hyaloscypha variabilis F]